jgi:hypothetical protein
MSQNRKTAEMRENDFRPCHVPHQARSLAYRRNANECCLGRARSWCSAALIHNHYPTIADAIRQEQGRGNRAQRNAKQQALKQERERARELRREIASLRADVQRLSSINEVLLAESAALRSRLGDQKVVALKRPKLVPRALLAGESGA